MTEFKPFHLVESSYSKRMLELDEQHKANFEQDMKLLADATPLMKDALKASDEGCKAIAQSMFDSGLIKNNGECRNLNNLLQAIYGYKMASSFQAFKDSYKYLIDNDFTDHIGTRLPQSLYASQDNSEAWCPNCDKTFSVAQAESGCPTCFEHRDQKRAYICGDNYVSACSLGAVSIVIIETQSDMWAFTHTAGFKQMFSLYRLRHTHRDPYKVDEFIEVMQSGNMREHEKRYDWEFNSDDPRFGLIVEVDLRRSEASLVGDVCAIDRALNFLGLAQEFTTW